jgi:hypothetical protein
MGNQALDQNEVLNVRWAHDDPNPVAKDAALRANADAVLAAMVVCLPLTVNSLFGIYICASSAGERPAAGTGSIRLPSVLCASGACSVT